MCSTVPMAHPIEPSINALLTISQAHNLLKFVQPVTLAFTDLEGRTIQLWQYKKRLFASVTDINDQVQILPGNMVHNPLQPQENDQALLTRLEKSSLKRWQFAYVQENGSIYVWPNMVAAGRTATTETEWETKFQANKEAINETYPGKKYDTRLKAARAELRGETLKLRSDGKPYAHYLSIDNARQGCKNFAEFCQTRVAHYTKEGDGLNKDKWETYLQDARNHVHKCNEALVFRDKSGLIGCAKTAQLALPIFKETLQQNRLTGSYNAGNPKNPVPEKATTGGSIGGVGNETGIMEGLFSTCDALEEDEHYFYIPSSDGEMPFSDGELQQLLEELSCGIFVHDTVPFFSLHFNGDGNMYPVIHPVYQNTLVGRVIGLLDYYMKGFLNGGFFEEAFVWKWQESKSQDKEFLRRHCQDLHAYCQSYLGPTCNYRSIRELIDLFKEQDGLLSSVEEGMMEDPILSDYSGFRSSFRIIAKQNSIKKGGSLFMLDGGFDVFYTVEPDPVYERELQRYRYQWGTDPIGYQRLIKAYDVMRDQIVTIMPQLPVFRKLFGELNVINFFSYYFKTLKQGQKVPLLRGERKVETPGVAACPPLFPHLPMRKMERFKVNISFGKVFERLTPQERSQVEEYSRSAAEGQQPPAEIIDLILSAFRGYLQTKVPFPLSEDDIAFNYHRAIIRDYLQSVPKEAQKVMKKAEEKLRLLANEKKTLNKNIFDLQEAQVTRSQKRKQAQKAKNEAESILFRDRYNREKIEKPFKPFFRPFFTLRLGVAFYNFLDNLLSLLLVAYYKKYQTQLAPLIPQAQRQLDSANHVLAQLENLEKDLGEQKECLKEVKEQIASIQAGDHLAIMNTHTECSFKESIAKTEFYSEQPEEDRDQNRRIVGGCGVNIHNLAVIFDSMAASLFQQTSPNLVDVEDGHLQAVRSARGVEGHVFKLKLADFRVSEDEEYGWMYNATAQTQEGLDMSGVDESLYTELHRAAATGDVGNMRALLQNRPDLLNQRAHNGATPLYVATQNGCLEAVRFFMERGADTNLATTHGMTPLYSAIHHGFEEIALEFLKSRSVDVNRGLEDGMTPLHAAVESGMLVIARRLIERGAHLNAARKDSYTPLHCAAREGSLNMCHLLLEQKDTEINARLKSQHVALHLAAEYRDPEIVGLFLHFKADLSCRGWDEETALMTAIRCGNPEAARLMIEYHKQLSKQSRGALSVVDCPNIRGETPLLAALSVRQHTTTEALLACGVQLPDPVTFLQLLCKAGYDHTYICEWIRTHQFSSKELQMACYLAAKHGHNAMVSLFEIEYGIVGKTDEKGWSRIHFAAMHDHINVIQRFLKQDPSDLLCVTQEGLSIVSIAAKYGSLRVLKLILDAMLKKGVSLALGKHPLLAAVEAGNVEAADIIAYKILKTNIPLDAEGKTAVHYAACFGDVEMLDLLRKRGADFYKQDALGKTAFHYGFEQGWDTVVDYFLDAANEFELPKNLLYYIANIKASRHIKKLIDRGFDVNIMGRETGETPIFRAIQGNQYEAFVTLCAHGANLGIRAKSDRTPLLLAAELGLSAFVAYLLPLVSKEETTSDGKNALHLAAIAGHEKCVQYLQDQGLDQSTINSRFLAPHIAMILKGESQELRRHKKEMIKALKQEDVTAFSDWSEPFAFHAPMDFDIEGRMARLPIAHLIYRLVKPGEKRIEILESMERDFTIRDPKGDTLAHIQAMQEEEIDFEAVDPLAKNQAGVTILHLCAAHSIENLQGAILKCASVDVEDEQGFTPLYYAVLAGQLPHVRLILEKGANPNHMSKVRGSPLFYAVEKNWPAIVTLLLQYGADIDQVCSGQKTTCLLRALERELFYMARLLINLGANPKKADGDGLAPIHLAAYKGKTTLVRHLVYAGASLKAVDKRGWTLAHHAAESKESELLDYLRPSLLRERSQKGASSARYPVSMPRQTPLDIAARRGNVAMLKKLKEKGVHAEKAE